MISALHLYAGQYVKVSPKQGDGVYSILRRYEIPRNDDYIDYFINLNKSSLGPGNSIDLNSSYYLPVRIFEYNGKSIRSTIDNPDWDNAVNIQKYNELLVKKGLKDADYRNNLKLWVPVFKIDAKAKKPVTTKKRLPQEVEYPIFGEKHKNIKIIDRKLAGHVYYVVGGHGGPDPGAVGYKNGHELHEDEYAYDVSLRLARNLIAHGAKVYVIVKDPNDGIRDDHYLNNSSDEYYHGGAEIDLNQLKRLRKRAEVINKLYYENEKNAKIQKCIIFHVDSRYTGQRIDIFFYHNPGSREGIDFSETLLATIREKYAAAQPGRGYEGTVSGRNLYMTRKTIPVTAFIEIGNIQNNLDQIRIIKPNNRQAIANWIKDGILRAAGQ